MIALLIPAGLFHGSVDSCLVGRPLDDLEWPHTHLAIGKWLASGLWAEALYFSIWPLILQHVSTDIFA